MTSIFFGGLFGIQSYLTGFLVRDAIRNAYLVCIREVSESHVGAIPHQFFVQVFHANSQITHHNHLIKRASILEIGKRLHTVLQRLLAGSYKIHLVTHTHTTQGNRGLWQIFEFAFR